MISFHRSFRSQGRDAISHLKSLPDDATVGSLASLSDGRTYSVDGSDYIMSHNLEHATCLAVAMGSGATIHTQGKLVATVM